MTPEKAPSAPSSPNIAALTVTQPARLETLLFSINKISEKAASGPANDMPMTGGGQTSGGATSAQTVSPRDQAIAKIPEPIVIQSVLKRHIQQEVHKLRREAKSIALRGPGAAYRLNQIYGKIRRLNSLLGELLEAGYEVLRRLYIRVFIDRQTIL